MKIVDQAKRFVESLHQLANRSGWDWRRCPHCGSTTTRKHGAYQRRAWFFEGRRVFRVQRHRCLSCERTHSEQSALLIRGSWYSREVHRMAIDQWQHTGSSLRRVAEWVRSWLGKQERWWNWRPLDPKGGAEQRCYLGASTVHRWVDKAGERAKEMVRGQLADVPASLQMGRTGCGPVCVTGQSGWSGRRWW